MRIMAIDYGDARTGLAVSDAMAMLVGDAWSFTEYNAMTVADTIVLEAKKREVETLVLGLPKNMDGSLGPRAEKSLELKALIEQRCAIPVLMWDERRTSIAAHDILHANGRKMKDHRKNVDAVAASLILEGYLGSL